MSNLPSLRYKERDSLTMHVNEVTKKHWREGRLQILIETFARQVERWWGIHQPHLQTWTTKLTYFIEIFGGKKLTLEANINKFLPRSNPQEH